MRLNTVLIIMKSNVLIRIIIHDKLGLGQMGLHRGEQIY